MMLSTQSGHRCLLELLGPRLEAFFHPVVLCFHPTLELGPILAQMDIRVHRPPCFPMVTFSYRVMRVTFTRITLEMEMSETACGLALGECRSILVYCTQGVLSSRGLDK